jgi:hypothetical protein
MTCKIQLSASTNIIYSISHKLKLDVDQPCTRLLFACIWGLFGHQAQICRSKKAKMPIITSTATCHVFNDPGKDSIMKCIFTFQPLHDLFPIQFSASFKDCDGPYSEVILSINLQPVPAGKLHNYALLPICISYPVR